LAAAVIVVLALGIWSLNAKLARLTPESKQMVVETATPKTSSPPAPDPASTAAADSVTPPAEHVTLDEELYFSLTPPEPPAEIIWH
jgi:hypothetical protein